MIDWPNLFANALWVVALAAALAVVSTASWRASLENTKMRDVLGRPGYQLTLLVCLAVFGLGLTLSVPSTLEKLAWGILTALTIVQIYVTRKSLSTPDSQKAEDREDT